MAKILIVDDEPYIRILMEQTLEELEDDGVELLIEENGFDGLEAIKKELPDLVFLDVMMPKMNGFDVCRKVKEDEKMGNVYIVLLTAKGQEFDKEHAGDVGADFYMTKPFNPDDVVEKAEEILSI